MKRCDIETELLIPGCSLVILGLGGSLYRAEIKSGWLYSNVLYNCTNRAIYCNAACTMHSTYYGGPLSRMSAATG